MYKVPSYKTSAHLNSKVKRSQKTDKIEFYSQLQLKDRNLSIKPLLSEREHFYNYKRPHSSLNGKTPYEQYLELKQQTPIQPEVTGKYWEKEEVIRTRNYRYLAILKKTKMSHMS